MAQDLNLVRNASGLYALTAPTEDLATRMRNRWVVQILSLEVQPRGSAILSEIASGRVRTNSDIVGLFGLTASRIVRNMRTLAEDVAPSRANLNDFTFIESNLAVELDFTVVSPQGSVQETVVVSETA